MSRSEIDHLVITALTLEQGAAYVQELLGVAPRTGGQHARMGTHNLLLRLGTQCYLEVIAPDPAAAVPDRPRWFGLDELRADSPPALTAWVVRTPDIRFAAEASPEALGDIVPMSRDTFDWLITIPSDGRLTLGGAAPALIEWRSGGHPAARLEDHGLSLMKLELHHPEPARLSRVLQSLRLEGPVFAMQAPGGTAPQLAAYFETPRGPKILSGPGTWLSV